MIYPAVYRLERTDAGTRGPGIAADNPPGLVTDTAQELEDGVVGQVGSDAESLTMTRAL